MFGFDSGLFERIPYGNMLKTARFLLLCLGGESLRFPVAGGRKS